MTKASLVESLACAAFALAVLPAQAAEHRCADMARERAGKLLAFHAAGLPGPAATIDLDKSVTELPPIRNPAQTEQRLEVLEVWGYVYKAQYRMHFLFAPVPDTCALVGQEILEYGTF